MKAIIMAGGEGSRLRPLTCNRPKPMVPVANRPMMSHIVELLKAHGFTDVAVTLQYMPEAIRDYFGNGVRYGINMQYFIEENPLGTAGSVKNAREFLDETFLVISGDALTDLDLTRAVAFHRQRGAMATLVLTRVSCPLEYGVVITKPDGRITQFLEKPGWGEVFSDTVNTGIYVLEPEVLEYIEPGRMVDFSKDLFPLLLREKKPLFGVVLPGYWCDIGNLQQYLQAHQDVLSGRVKTAIPGREIQPGVWVGDGVEISSNARITGPVLIGDGCYIGPGAEIESFSVLGEGCLIQEQASIKRSVLWNNVYIGPGAALRGAIVAGRVQVQAHAAVYEGAVIGSDSVIQERSVVKPDVKLWPHKLVESGAVVQNSLVWGTRCPKKIFGLEGISGLVNVELTPEFACRVGAAFASAMGNRGVRLAVSSDASPASRMIKSALTCGLQSAGAQVVDLDTGITPMHRFAVRQLALAGGVHVRLSPHRSDHVTMIFINGKGGNISRNVERKVENLLMREDFHRAEPQAILPPEFVSAVGESYIEALMRDLDPAVLEEARFRLVVACDRDNLGPYLKHLTGKLGVTVENLDLPAGTPPATWRNYQETLSFLGRRVRETGAAAGALLDANGDRLVLVDERGRVIQDNLLTALIALIILRARGGPVVVPVTAPRAIDTLAEKYRGQVVRTKTAVHDFVEKVLGQDEFQFLLNFDALGALTRILEFTAKNGITLGELVDEIPTFFMDQKEVPVPWEVKGRVIRRLIEDPPTAQLEMLDGVKVFHPQGWALVLPDPDEPVCRVFTEGASMEIARSLSDFYIDKISQIAKSAEATG
ncbi:Mannose-1-phosphate guanylyltransferase., Phosphomannomutase [Desulfofundulus kuznetsovii DSM 6115]|uniref:Mannose-1-phosphate guanylyltransferase., Phosphomannomutase n=1 Tax=Desulfofundulus kuznetsovii (strain DSM 6115 / VKM B-1805 / 17) TaxID=760568 RepID=A0AAU8PHR1_DESK7|nr:Mannose-1-phosphate guanylyltransferase., Phosphomannomutase [Desulfofundulus kuznetsovii DSM 6115]